MPRQPAVYILANQAYGIFYTGVTGNLAQRIWVHKQDLLEGFSKKHQTHLLVWYELHESMISAIEREKLIKRWHRDWKINLVQQMNPGWRDLFDTLI
jgi:putative endonuclease